MWASIIGIIQGILQVIPILSKYFAPKTPIEDQTSGDNSVNDEIDKINKTGRP